MSQNKNNDKKNNPAIEDLDKKLVYTTFLQQEENRYHHSYNEELLQYEYIRDGDMRSVEESKRLFRTGIAGKLSDDPVVDKKYLFVASTTLATRFCIEGGMDSQEAYNMSDLVIQELATCFTVKDINELHTIMVTNFTQKMYDIHHSPENIVYSSDLTDEYRISKPVIECIDYIYYHLHSKITLKELSYVAALSPNYLASLFKKEKGITIHEYIRHRKIEVAENMLIYSDYSSTEIGEFLAFSSNSHFIKVFREETGLTPKEYKLKNFRKHTKWSE